MKKVLLSFFFVFGASALLFGCSGTSKEDPKTPEDSENAKMDINLAPPPETIPDPPPFPEGE